MIVQDDFCQDKELLARLSDEAAWSSDRGTHWWDGWWSRPPEQVWEETVMMVWRRYAGIERQIAGFEYWSNTLTPERASHLGWHNDKDETRYKQTGEVVSPTTGTIFYCYPHDVDGGYLEISKDETLSDVERIEPVYNRLVIFDASRWHRVSKVYSGVRRAFLVNLWPEKPRTYQV